MVTRTNPEWNELPECNHFSTFIRNLQAASTQVVMYLHSLTLPCDRDCLSFTFNPRLLSDALFVTCLPKGGVEITNP